MERTLIEDTQQIQNSGGPRIWALPGAGPNAARVDVVDAIIRKGTGYGVYLGDSEGSLERTIVRDTQPLADDMEGGGVSADCRGNALEFKERRALVTMRDCLVADNGYAATSWLNANAVLERTVMRDTATRWVTRVGGDPFAAGFGIIAARSRASAQALSVRECILARNRYVSLSTAGVEATVVRTVIRDSLATDQHARKNQRSPMAV